MESPFVFDVTATGFDAQVVARSHEVPVLLDFWAEWCGPCRALGPVLEQLAEEYGGAFLLGKVDTEREQDLAYAFQVQSIPFCVLMVGGKPADAFAGALPEPEVRKFLTSHGVEPSAPVAAEPVDPDTAEARLRAGLAAAARGDVAAARERLDGIQEEEPQSSAAGRILDGLDAQSAPLSGASSPAAAAIAGGREKLAAGDFDGAAEAFLESIAADKEFMAGIARRSILLCFELMGLEPDADDRIAPLRRRLATLLF